jgi:uncharacterized protein
MKFGPSKTVTQNFYDHIVSNSRLCHSATYGKEHWLRVLQNGRELAAITGANIRVVEVFALLHDSKRENELEDPGHGRRAAEYARSLQGTWLSLSESELDLLCDACAYHSDGLIEADLTIQACWDADRLDIGRFGIRPDPQLLCTAFAKRQDIMNAAYSISLVLPRTVGSCVNKAALDLIMNKIKDDWWESYREFSILSAACEISDIDEGALTRKINASFFMIPEYNGLECAATVPSFFLREDCAWCLTWPDVESFSDPRGFESSDCVDGTRKIMKLEWGDPRLPANVVDEAISSIDWLGTGELLDDWVADGDENLLDVPDAIRKNLLDALYRYRREASENYRRH